MNDRNNIHKIFEKKSSTCTTETRSRKLSPNEKENILIIDEELNNILLVTKRPRLHKLYQKCE